jgi:hypothetical protein
VGVGRSHSTAHSPNAITSGFNDHKIVDVIARGVGRGATVLGAARPSGASLGATLSEVVQFLLTSRT